MADKNGKWMIWTVGSLFTVLTGIMTVTGSGVIANERDNIKQHKEIRREIQRGDEKVQGTLSEEIKELRIEQKAMRKEQMTMWQDQSQKFTEILVAIEKIKK